MVPRSGVVFAPEMPSPLRRRRVSRLGAVLCLAALRCTSAPAPEDPSTRTLAACRAAAAAPGSLRTVADFTRHVNMLPRPVTVPCFVASLPRPLSIVAATSPISGQPTPDADNPRLFLLFPTITITVLADGTAAEQIEFAEWVDATHSLKAELAMPPRPNLADDAAFARVRLDGGVGTTCGLCHRDELPSERIPSAFVSLAYRPPTSALIGFGQLPVIAAASCAGSRVSSGRCLFWHALMDYGELRPGAFDPSVGLFLQD